jgi:hypothetical protein
MAPMAINSLDCFSEYKTDQCDRAPANRLNFLDIVGVGGGVSMAEQVFRRNPLIDALLEADKKKPQPEKGDAGLPITKEPPKSEQSKVPPKIETPKIEAPKIEAPKVDRPKAETPKPETPKIDTPKIEGPKTPTDRKIDELIKLLPDHPVKGVMKGLMEGILTGNMNTEQIADAMRIFERSYKMGDMTNLPSVTSDDFPIGDSPEVAMRIRKACFKFNDALMQLGLKMELVDNRGILVYDLRTPRTNLGVQLNGNLDAFQGRRSHPGIKSLDPAVALKELSKIANERIATR